MTDPTVNFALAYSFWKRFARSSCALASADPASSEGLRLDSPNTGSADPVAPPDEEDEVDFLAVGSTDGVAT